MIKKHIYIILSCFLISLNSCSTKGYEIEEIEETEDLPPPGPTTDIKSEIENTSKDIQPEIPVSSNKVSSVRYAIQIGAFFYESNAMKVIEKFKLQLSYDVYYKLVDELYKVWVGEFETKEQAGVVLSALKDAGFVDSFIIAK